MTDLATRLRDAGVPSRQAEKDYWEEQWPDEGYRALIVADREAIFAVLLRERLERLMAEDCWVFHDNPNLGTIDGMLDAFELAAPLPEESRG